MSQACEHIVLPLDIYGIRSGSSHLMPDGFWSITQHDPFDAGDWASHVYMCSQCETCYLMSYNPRDDIFDSAIVLPEVYKAACRRAVSVAGMERLLALPASNDSGRQANLTDLVRSALSRAEYNLQAMFDMLVKRRGAATIIGQQRNATAWLRLFLEGETVRREWLKVNFQRSVLHHDDPTAWFEWLDQHDSMAEVLRLAFGIRSPEQAPLVALGGDPLERLDLLAAIGIKDRALPDYQVNALRRRFRQPGAKFRSHYSKKSGRESR